jgi:predicted nucleic acid-binding protein
MQKVFLDTGYVVALEASDDQRHDEAAAHWKKFIAERPRMVTTNYVFDEVVTFFNSRDCHEKAVEIGERFRDSKMIELVAVNENLFEKGWAYFRKHDDKQYSLTDCISFVVMEKRDMRRALAFDNHFEQAGFQRLP